MQAFFDTTEPLALSGLMKTLKQLNKKAAHRWSAALCLLP